MDKEKRKIINQLRKHGNISEAARVAGITRQRIYRWQDRDREFREQAARARAEFLQSTI